MIDPIRAVGQLKDVDLPRRRDTPKKIRKSRPGETALGKTGGASPHACDDWPGRAVEAGKSCEEIPPGLRSWAALPAAAIRSYILRMLRRSISCMLAGVLAALGLDLLAASSDGGRASGLVIVAAGFLAGVDLVWLAEEFVDGATCLREADA